MSTNTAAGRFTDELIGRIGAIGQFMGMVGSLSVPALIDAFGLQRQMKGALTITMALMTGSIVLFTYLVWVPLLLALWALRAHSLVLSPKLQDSIASSTKSRLAVFI